MTDTAEETEQTRIIRQRAPKLTGARELLLIEELATGDLAHAELAERFECAEHTITNFASRNSDRIAAAAQAQVAKLPAEVWIGRKEMRLAQYQAEVLRNLRLIEEMEETAAATAESLGLPGLGPDPDKIARLQTNIFRALAAAREESGDGDRGRSLVHIIKGV
jgi:hypothetical protein